MAIRTIDDTSLVNIASAIRTKLESTDTYRPDQMAQKILDIPVSEPDWTELGYESAPDSVILGFNYAKQIMDNWDPNPSNTSLNNKFRDDTRLVYFPFVDTSKYTQCHYMFNGCKGLTFVAEGLDFSSITQCNNMFNDCTALKSIKIGPFGNGSITNIDAHNICQNLKSLEHAELDCSNISNLGWAFSACNYLSNTVLTNMDNVTTIQRAFEACYRFTGSLDLDLPACTNCDSTFVNFAQLEEPDEDMIITMNVPVVTTLNQAFFQGDYERSYIKEIHLTTGNSLTTLEKAFRCNTTLETLTITNTSHVQSFKNSLENCYSMINIPLMDGSSCVDGGLNYAFSKCGSNGNLTDESLDNILQLCISATNESHKTLTYIGWGNEMQTAYPASRIMQLPHWDDFDTAGWSLGFS